jgi:hypothetical protein
MSLKAICAAALMAVGTAAPAASLLKISGGNSVAVPGNNDFKGQLHSLFGLDFYSTNRTITLTHAARLTFFFLGSASGFTNSFASGPISWLETDSNHFISPVAISGSYVLGPGTYKPYFHTPSGGATAAPSYPGNTGFGIFLPSGSASGFSASSLVFGYDDPTSNNPANFDKDYDDFMVQVVASPTPEPEAWASLGVGMGLAAFVARRRRKRAAT